jgi:hypothetical protein
VRHGDLLDEFAGVDAVHKGCDSRASIIALARSKEYMFQPNVLWRE